MAEVQDWLGHANISTTSLYSRRNRKYESRICELNSIIEVFMEIGSYTQDIVAVATVILAIATVSLACATWRLAQHSRALSDLTEQLVNIQKVQKRQVDLSRYLKHAEDLQKCDPFEFAEQLKQGKIPERESRHIKELALAGDEFIKDPDTVKNLRILRQTLDSVQRDSSIGDNEKEIARRFKSVQDRIVWSIDNWREELES